MVRFVHRYIKETGTKAQKIGEQQVVDLLLPRICETGFNFEYEIFLAQCEISKGRILKCPDYLKTVPPPVLV